MPVSVFLHQLCNSLTTPCACAAFLTNYWHTHDYCYGHQRENIPSAVWVDSHEAFGSCVRVVSCVNKVGSRYAILHPIPSSVFNSVPSNRRKLTSWKRCCSCMLVRAQLFLGCMHKYLLYDNIGAASVASKFLCSNSSE